MSGDRGQAPGERPAMVKAMENREMDAMVAQQLKRLWTLLSDLDQAHLARLARAAGRPPLRPSHGRPA